MKRNVMYNTSKKELIIEGKRYKVSMETKPEIKGHGGNTVFSEIDENYEKRLVALSKKLAKQVKGKLLLSDIILEALKLQPTRAIARLEGKIKKKQKAKIERGCLALDVGGSKVWIVP